MGISQEATNLFGLGKKADAPKEKSPEKEYRVPEARAVGRPHNLGWLDLLGDEEVTGGSFGDGDDSIYESDNWREVIAKRQRIGKS